MRRRDILRRGGCSLVATVGIAGCPGDGTSETMPAFEQESAGSVARNAIEELAIVGWTSAITEGTFSVDVVVRNAGDRTIDALAPTYRIRPYDGDGNRIEPSGQTETDSEGDGELPPGKTTTVRVTPHVDVDPSAVATYEILLDCSGLLAQGPYCP